MRLRGLISGLLLFLGCVTALAAVPVRWADQQIHSDNYADTIRPLVKNPELQSALADLLLETAEDKTGQKLPPQAQAVVKTQVATVMNTPEATDLWVQANVTARDAVVNGTGNQVAVDVNQLAGELRGPVEEKLKPYNVSLPELPASAGKIVLVDDPAVGQARETIQQIQQLASILPWVAIGLLAAAVAVSARRGRSLVAAGFGIGIPALIGVLVLTLAGASVAAAFGDSQTQPFILALGDAFVGSLRADLLWLLVACALAIVGGFVLSAVTSRRGEREDPAYGPDYDDYEAGPPPYQPQPYQQAQGYGQPQYPQQQYPPQPQPYPGQQQPYPGQYQQPPQYGRQPQQQPYYGQQDDRY
ncbi:hypothetical protein [Flindersiella endophytica]